MPNVWRGGLLTVAMFAGPAWGQAKDDARYAKFVPKGFLIVETIRGDLNKDGRDDAVLLIKGTNPKRIVHEKNRGPLDRNRRGLVILFNTKDRVELATQNIDCFSSEHEDGGVYFPPELELEIRKGNLYVTFGHGRYGHWVYTLRYQKSDFELIGYDSTSGGVVMDSAISINFLTKTKVERVNTNQNAKGGDELFKVTRSKIKVDKLMRLRDIKDFDELRSEY